MHHQLDSLARTRHRRSKRRSNSPPYNRGLAARSNYYLYGAIFLILSFSVSQITLGHEARDQVIRGGPPATSVGDPSFSYASQWGSYGGPIMPNGVATDSSGNVYIADAKDYAIVKLARNGSFITSWGSYGSGHGQFSNPEGIALDTSGNVFVSDSVNNNVQKFTNTGGFVVSWNTWNKTSILSHPFGVSVNSTGFVYVVDQGDKRVQIYRNNGTYVGTFGGSGTGPGKFLTPFGIAVNSSFVYVSDNSIQSGNVTEFTKTGGFVCAWGAMNLGEPAMLSVDNSSNIYIADNFYGDIVKFSPCNSKPLWSSGSIGAGPGEFNGPVGVALDQTNVLVGDSENFRVEKLSASAGSYVSSLTYPRLGLFSSPFDTAFDGAGSIYIADEGNSRIQKFSLAGLFLSSWGATESAGALFDPFGITVDHTGSVYVADYSNGRVEKFLPNGTYVRDLGSGNKQFVNPYGVAVDPSNNVYVTDNANNTVQTFDSSGSFITEWSSKTGNCQFSNPTGIAVDSSGNVYVSDSGNNRIEKCTASGGFLLAWGSSGSGNGLFDYPSHLALDSAGNLYVADTFNSRIQEFTNNGTFLTSFGMVGTGNGQLVYPRGLVVDNSGNVYVADTGSSLNTSNNRIEVFAVSTSLSNGGSCGGRRGLAM